MSSFSFPLVVTVHTAAVGVDDYGNPTPSSYSSVTAYGDVQPVRTDEAIDGISATQVDEVRFFLAAGTTVAAGDRLEARGVTYEAIGPPDERDYGRPLDYVRIRARRTA